MSEGKVKFTITRKVIWFSTTQRAHNIEQIRHLIKQGLTFEEIWAYACLYISNNRFAEYYRLAQKAIEEESKK